MKTPFAVLTAAFALASLLVAAAQPDAELANFDARLQGVPQHQALAGQRETAASELKRKIPGIQIDLDQVTAAPSWIQSAIGFLTGPDAEEGIVPKAPYAVPPRVDAPDAHPSVKQFLDENSAVFGHDSTILNDARISREFVTAHNGMRTIVWEQVLDGIP